MGMQDLITPLTAAHLMDKATEDEHYGMFVNKLYDGFADFQTDGGRFGTLYNASGNPIVNPYVVLGNGTFQAGFYFYNPGFPAAVGGLYHPTAYYLSVPYPFKMTESPPGTFMSVTLEDSQKIDAITVGGFPSIRTWSKMCAILTIWVLSPSISGAVKAAGYITVEI